jgi:hypothetical protein
VSPGALQGLTGTPSHGIAEGISQTFGKGGMMSTRQLWAILRAIEGQGLRWQNDAHGRKVETVRDSGRYWVTDTATRYELDTLPGMATRLAEVAGAIAQVVGAPVAIDESDGRVFVTVTHAAQGDELGALLQDLERRAGVREAQPQRRRPAPLGDAQACPF